MRSLHLLSAGLLLIHCSACLQAQPGRYGPQTRQSNPSGRDHASMRRLFAPAIATLHPSVVEVVCGEKVVALGTVCAPSGLILTKHSELEGAVQLRRPGESLRPGTLVHVDESNDLAVLRVAGHPWTGVRLAPRNETRVGSFVISAAPRALPLAIGVMSVPRHPRKLRSFLGVRSEKAAKGVKVTEVVPRSAAAEAGIKVDDVLLSLAGAKTPDVPSLRAAITSQPVGTPVLLRLVRAGVEKKLELELGRPQDRKGPVSSQERSRLWGPLSEVRLGMEEVIQHDGVIRPEHCGSPLVNLSSEVVGINIARVGRYQTLALTARIAARILAKAAEKRRPRRRVIR